MGWIDGTLDELEARVRALRRELDRLERELAACQSGDSGGQGRGGGAVHDVTAVRRRLVAAAPVDAVA